MDAIIRVVVLVVSLIRSFYDGSTRVYPTDPPTDQPIDKQGKTGGGEEDAAAHSTANKISCFCCCCCFCERPL